MICHGFLQGKERRDDEWSQSKCCGPTGWLSLQESHVFLGMKWKALMIGILQQGQLSTPYYPHIHLHVCVLNRFSRVWLCDPMDYSLLGSSVHGILQARILKWVAIPFSRGSSRPRDGTQVSHIADGFFIIWATKEDQNGGLEWVNLIQMTIISTLIGKNPSEEME